MRQLCICALAVGTAVALVCWSVTSAWGDADENASSNLVAGSDCGQWVVVMPMDDDYNPYQGQYRLWDSWVFENAVQPDRELEDSSQGTSPAAGQDHLRLYVTAQGFAVPLLEYYAGVYAADGLEPVPNCPYFFSANGSLPESLRGELVNEIATIRAASLPTIPSWLADQPPLWALLLQTGEVATLGQLGSGAKQQPALPGPGRPKANESCFRYSAQGELLGQTGPGEEWWRLYFKDFGEIIESYRSSTVSYQELNGYIIIQDPANISVFDVFDYRGNKTSDPTDVFKARQAFLWIDGGNLKLAYILQLAQDTP